MKGLMTTSLFREEQEEGQERDLAEIGEFGAELHEEEEVVKAEVPESEVGMG